MVPSGNAKEREIDEQLFWASPPTLPSTREPATPFDPMFAGVSPVRVDAAPGSVPFLAL
jgi:hypothetical protein